MKQGVAVYVVLFVLLVGVGGLAIWGFPAENAPGTPARDIRELIARHEIAVTATGKCPTGIYLKVVSKVDEDLRVIVPAGTFFVAQPLQADPTIVTGAPAEFSDMVTTSPVEFPLPAQDTAKMSIGPVCANTLHRYDGEARNFDLKTLPAQSNLARVAAVLADKPYTIEPSFVVSQAAVWIVTDDADYNDLGMLGIDYYGNGRSAGGGEGGNDPRAIQPLDVVLALDVLDKAGVNVQARKIWADREMILRLAATPLDQSGRPIASPEQEGASPGEPEAPKPPAPIVRPFRDCPACPEMVRVRDDYAVGRYEVTFAQWDACVADDGCRGYTPTDDGRGRGSRPVTHVSFDDAKAYVEWLSGRTNGPYALLYDPVWRLALRGDAAARASMRDPDLICDEGARIGARFSVCLADRTRSDGAIRPNALGVYDMPGNVWEWTDGCADSACSTHALLGGSGYFSRQALPSSYRSGPIVGIRDIGIGFRVSKALRVVR